MFHRACLTIVASTAQPRAAIIYQPHEYFNTAMHTTLSLNPRACSRKGDDEPVRCQRKTSKSSEKENFTWITATAHVCMARLHNDWPQPTSTVAKVATEPVRRTRQQPIYNPRQHLFNLQIDIQSSNCKSIYMNINNSKITILCFHKINFIDFVFPQTQLNRFCVSTKNKNYKIQKMWKHKID